MFAHINVVLFNRTEKTLPQVYVRVVSKYSVRFVEGKWETCEEWVHPFFTLQSIARRVSTQDNRAWSE